MGRTMAASVDPSPWGPSSTQLSSWSYQLPAYLWEVPFLPGLHCSFIKWMRLHVLWLPWLCSCPNIGACVDQGMPDSSGSPSLGSLTVAWVNPSHSTPRLLGQESRVPV